jgi:hypothetical protein
VKDRASEILKIISKEKKVAEIKLAKAQPALDAAEAALLVRLTIILNFLIKIV